MSTDRFRTQSLPEGSRNTYVTITINGVLAKNVFASRWEHEGRNLLDYPAGGAQGLPRAPTSHYTTLDPDR
jgi:hypothetical protein